MSGAHDTRARRTLWIYTVAHPHLPPITAQRDRLYAWARERRIVHLKAHRLGATLWNDDSGGTCLSLALFARLGRCDQVAICQEAFRMMGPTAQHALAKLDRHLHAPIWVISPDGQHRPARQLCQPMPQLPPEDPENPCETPKTAQP